MSQQTVTRDAQAEAKNSHPPGLYLLFFTEMWERFSYYGMRGLLTLYLTKTVAEGGMGWNPKDAVLLYGYFTGFVYLTPIIGGWIADTYLGQRRSILIGGILMMFGQFSLASQVGAGSFYLGLLLLIIGNGFFKPNISTIVGSLYAQGDPRRDSAFTIFYQGINLGAFLAPLVCGYLAEDLMTSTTMVNGETLKVYGFRYGFLAAGIGMLLGQIMFNMLSQKYLGDIGKYPEAKALDASGKKQPATKLTKEETDRVAVILVITTFVIFFWACFEQAGSSLTIYTDKFINRTVFGWTIPTSWFQSVNPLFIVSLAPITSALWLNLATKKKDPNTAIKMGIGMILLGIGFLFMVGAAMERGGDVTDENVKANLMWLVMTYLFHTMGELCLSPIGLSMVTRLAPIAYASMLMGVWFVSNFIANILGGYLAAYVEQLGAITIFGGIAVVVAVLGLVLIALAKKLVFMMHGR